MHVTLVIPQTAPRTAASAATFSAAATPTCGLPWSSASRTSIFRPRTPPFLFHSSAASLTASRSEEHTSELQTRLHLLCRLLLEKKKKITGSVMLHTST